MLTRRMFLLALPATYATGRARVVLAASEHDRNGKQLGDKGFRHDELHQLYPMYFDTIRCPCKDGECRPTKWQRDPRDAHIIQVWIDREWVSASKTTDIRDQRHLPPDFPKALRRYSAHACAYGGRAEGTPAVATCIWVIDARV